MLTKLVPIAHSQSMHISTREGTQAYFPKMLGDSISSCNLKFCARTSGMYYSVNVLYIIIFLHNNYYVHVGNNCRPLPGHYPVSGVHEARGTPVRCAAFGGYVSCPTGPVPELCGTTAILPDGE